MDCEYNRQGNNTKRLPFDSSENVAIDDTNARTVFPDIVVHCRGVEEYNLLVIEAKKSGRDRDQDVSKLQCFTSDGYNYFRGLLIIVDMPAGSSHEMCWYADGEPTDD